MLVSWCLYIHTWDDSDGNFQAGQRILHELMSWCIPNWSDWTLALVWSFKQFLGYCCSCALCHMYCWMNLDQCHLVLERIKDDNHALNNKSITSFLVCMKGPSLYLRKPSFLSTNTNLSQCNAIPVESSLSKPQQCEFGNNDLATSNVFYWSIMKARNFDITFTLPLN